MLELLKDKVMTHLGETAMQKWYFYATFTKGKST